MILECFYWSTLNTQMWTMKLMAAATRKPANSSCLWQANFHKTSINIFHFLSTSLINFTFFVCGFQQWVHGMSISTQITLPTTSIKQSSWTAKASQEVQWKSNPLTEEVTPLQRKQLFQFLKIRDFFLAFKICWINNYVLTNIQHWKVKNYLCTIICNLPY